MCDKVRFRLAVAAADAYQFTGRHNGPAFVLDFFCWLSRALDPEKVPPDCINPAMLKGIAKSLGMPVETLLEDQRTALDSEENGCRVKVEGVTREEDCENGG